MSSKCSAHEESCLRVVSGVHTIVTVSLGVLSQFYNHHQIQMCVHSLNINLGYLGHSSATVAQAVEKGVSLIHHNDSSCPYSQFAHYYL
ncbi:12877_t:CDS:2 [Gigaspora rosea]|nr:12877_t:CDS:2 [Gigaspora rosea]